MTIETTIETTVKGGLPVRAQATIETCHSLDYPGCDYIDSFEVSWKSGHAFREKLSADDKCRIFEELFEEARRNYWEVMS